MNLAAISFKYISSITEAEIITVVTQLDLHEKSIRWIAIPRLQTIAAKLMGKWIRFVCDGDGVASSYVCY